MSDVRDRGRKQLYASCEKVFRPDLRNQAVVVLSNNDGCVIARSAESKKYVRMGEPWFKIKNENFPVKIHSFSSNYALYASMSNRVMSVIEAMTPRVEQYSMIEMFLDVHGIDFCTDFETFGREVRCCGESTLAWRVGVGIG